MRAGRGSRGQLQEGTGVWGRKKEWGLQSLLLIQETRSASKTGRQMQPQRRAWREGHK